jgi:hypothetical protein
MMTRFLASEADAQRQMRGIAAELEAIRFRLLGVRASLQVPPLEPVMLAGEMDMDISTEVRSIIECVVNDFIDSAIRDLQTAADYRPGEEEKR